MTKNNVQIGNKVDVIRHEKMKNGDDSPVLSSKIVDILDDETIVIYMPMDKTVTVPLRLNEKVEMFFYTANYMLSAQVIVKDRYFEGPLSVAKLQVISPFEKLQRRQYYRVECYIPFKFVILEEVAVDKLLSFGGTDRLTLRNYQNHIEEMEEEIRIWQSGVIVDLSGGGIRFVTETDVDKGDAILLSMQLNNGDTEDDIIVVSRVVNVEEKLEPRGKVEVRARFYKIQDSLRDIIVKFVFDKERKARSMSNKDYNEYKDYKE